MPIAQKIILITYSCFISLFAYSQSQRELDELRNLTIYNSSKKPPLAQEDLFSRFIQYFASKPIEPYIMYEDNVGKRRIHYDSMIYVIREQLDLFIESWKRDSTKNKNIITTKGEQIYQKITKNYSLDSNSRSKTELRSIYQQIHFLPYTSERIYLLLEYENLSLSTKDFYTDLHRIWSFSRGEIEKITSVLEKAKAYKILGDFVANKGRSVLAIEMYYLASENFQKTSFSDIELMANIADIYGENGLEYGLLKALLYYKIGSIYASEQWSIQELDYINALIQFYWRYGSSNSQNLTSDSSLQAGLNKIIQWNRRYNMGSLSSFEISYLTFSCIGNTLASLQKYQHAFPYLTQSFWFALKTKNLAYISNCLYDIATVCKNYGKFQLALNYLFLERNLADSTNNYSANVHNYLTEVEFLLDVGNTTSSYLLISEIEKDTAIFAQNLYPPFYTRILERISQIKFRLFDSDITKVDSARYYENVNRNYQVFHLNELIAKYDIEARALLDLTNRANKIALAASDSLARSQKEIARLAKKSEKQAKEKSKQDSIARVQSDSISNLNVRNAALARDSAAQAIEIANLEIAKRKEIEKLNMQINDQNDVIKTRNYWLLISVIIVGSFLAFSIFQIFRNKRIQKKLLDATTSELCFRSAIKNHNLDGHYMKIEDMLDDGRIPEAKLYCQANSKYFEPYYKALLNTKVSVLEEVELLKLFISTEMIYKNLTITPIVIYNNVDAVNTYFLTDILVPLYENVLLNGFVEMRSDYSFTVELTKNKNLLEAKIYDNGEGTENIESEIKEQHYLDMLQKRLLNYFKLKRISTDPLEVFRIRSNIGVGTEINIKMPYETIQNTFARK